MPQIIGRNGGEDTLAHWPTVSGMMTVDDASCEVLKYLDKIWNSLSSSGRILMLCLQTPFQICGLTEKYFGTTKAPDIFWYLNK